MASISEKGHGVDGRYGIAAVFRRCASRWGKNSREPKLLDGVDTLIIATAIHVATVNNARQCVIVSNDKGLSLALCSLRQGGIGHHGGIPENIEVRKISGI